MCYVIQKISQFAKATNNSYADAISENLYPWIYSKVNRK